jgi:hypothetical protein
MSSGTSKVQLSNDEAEVRAVIDATTKAHREKDVTAIGARYAPEIVSYDLSPPLVHRGFNAKEKQYSLDTWEGPIEIVSRAEAPNIARRLPSGDRLQFAIGFCVKICVVLPVVTSNRNNVIRGPR